MLAQGEVPIGSKNQVSWIGQLFAEPQPRDPGNIQVWP